MMGPELLATVVIPTFNGERYLARLLEALRHQKVPGDYEVLIIDSGSTDDTLRIIGEFPEVRLHQIKNSEFGHGRTRNLAAQLASGEFVAYLSHDAVPASDTWLAELLSPFSVNPSVVAVMGKQVARPGCFPLMRYEISGVFSQFGPDFGTSLFYFGDTTFTEGQKNAIAFYSDVNSAVRRDFLLNKLPYRDVPYAEDQLFGRELTEAGYWKAYAPRAAVEHSNDVTLQEFALRIFDETVGLRKIGTPIGPLSRRGQIKYTLLTTFADSIRIIRDPGYSTKRKLYWLAVNPLYHQKKWSGYRRASIVDIDDAVALQRFSLEHSRKQG